MAFRSRVPPPGWKEYTHPLGALYFYHEEYVRSLLSSSPVKNSSHLDVQSSQRILTEAYLYDDATYQATMGFIHSIQTFLHHHEIKLESDTEIVLDITENDGFVCGYYLVSHTRRVIFWLDDFPTSYICSPVIPVLSLSHLSAFLRSYCSCKAEILLTWTWLDRIVEHQIEAEYWAHWDLFPHIRQVTPSLIAELRDDLTHGIVGE